HRPQRHLEHVVGFPKHDVGLDPEAVAEPLPSLAFTGEVDYDVDPLLLDAQRRHAREAAGLDPAHDALEHLVAAPCVDQDRLPRLDAHRVGRQQVYHHFEIDRIADLDQRLAGRHHSFALAQDLEYRPADR